MVELVLYLLEGYRVTPYEFAKYWKYEGSSCVMVLLLYDLYKGSADYMRDLVYTKNPFLSMMPKDESKGVYYPVPVVFRQY